MKLLDIDPIAVMNYAYEHNFWVKEYFVVSELKEDPDTLSKCLERAEKEGCIEYCKAEIREGYNPETDETKYWFSVYAFAPINSPCPKDNLGIDI